jgi:hypothetical protein
VRARRNLGVPEDDGAPVLLDGRHPGGVVEASDVRGDERRKHYEQYRRERVRYLSKETGPPCTELCAVRVTTGWRMAAAAVSGSNLKLLAWCTTAFPTDPV